jgi:hypothetical protein
MFVCDLRTAKTTSLGSGQGTNLDFLVSCHAEIGFEAPDGDFILAQTIEIHSGNEREIQRRGWYY